MEITETTEEQGRVTVTILHPKDRINLGNAEELQDKARQVYEHGARNLVLDLAEVPSLTSAGLRAIHYIYKLFGGQVELAGPTGQTHKTPYFKLASPDPYVRRVITIAGFDRFIEIHDSLQDALASFSPS